MSLKAVHILFVISAILLCLGTGGVLFRHYQHEGGMGRLAFSVAWLACGFALAFYGKRVVRKLREISYF